MGKKLQLDEIDREIVLQLRKDGRMSNADLARHVSLSAPACLRRVKHLEDSGVIRGYRAVIDPAAFGHALEVFVWVDLDASNREAMLAFEDRVSQMEEGVECHRVFGRPDFFMRVLVRDPADYEDFLTNKLIGVPSVLRVTSTPSLKKIKTEDHGWSEGVLG